MNIKKQGLIYLCPLVLSSLSYAKAPSLEDSNQHRVRKNINQNQIEMVNRAQLKTLEQNHYKEQAESLNLAFKNLLLNEVNGPRGLKTLSNQSMASSSKNLTVTTYMASVNKFEESLSNLKRTIRSANKLSKELKKNYEDQLNELENQMNALQFRLILPSGSVMTQQGLTYSNLKDMNLYSSDEINQMRNEMTSKRAFQTLGQQQIDQGLNKFTLQKMYQFVDAFGSSQRYRSQSNTDALKQAKEDLDETFWLRSHLRSVYGMKLGSFGIKYNKRWFNLDYLLGPNSMELLSQVIRNENDLMSMQDLAYNALETYTGKSAKVLKLSTPFFARISSFKTFLQGSRQETSMNSYILKLMIADIEEEKMLGTGGGLRKIREHYRSRFLSTSEDKMYYENLKRNYFKEDPLDDETNLDGEDYEDDIEADVEMVSNDALKGVIDSTQQVLENQEDRLFEARGIETTIKKLTQNNTVKRTRNRRHQF